MSRRTFHGGDFFSVILYNISGNDKLKSIIYISDNTCVCLSLKEVVQHKIALVCRRSTLCSIMALGKKQHYSFGSANYTQVCNTLLLHLFMYNKLKHL